MYMAEPSLLLALPTYKPVNIGPCLKPTLNLSDNSPMHA